MCYSMHHVLPNVPPNVYHVLPNVPYANPTYHALINVPCGTQCTMRYSMYHILPNVPCTTQCNVQIIELLTRE